MATGSASDVGVNINEMTDDELRIIVQKDSSARLQQELRMQECFSEEQISAFSRNELISNVAVLRRFAKQTTSVRDIIPEYIAFIDKRIAESVVPSEPTVAVTDPSGVMMQMFMQFMQTQVSRDEARYQAEAEERREAREIERERIELERHKSDEQFRILQKSLEDANEQRLRELQKSERSEAKAKDDRDKIEVRLKRASSLMKHVLFKMPSNVADITLWFASVEQLFERNHVDADLRIALLTPYLTEDARRLILNLPSTSITTYETFKAVVLKE